MGEDGAAITDDNKPIDNESALQPTLNESSKSGVVMKPMQPTTSVSRDSHERHSKWQNPTDFLIALVAYAISLGNVWRFPYLAFKHGGGTFLMAYSVYFVCTAVPMVLMEASLGQYLGLGATELWKIFPILKGVGFGNMAICFSTVVYFPVIISWSLFYLINSYKFPFPWNSCNNYWNDQETCFYTLNATRTVHHSDNLNLTLEAAHNNTNITLQTSSQQYYLRRVLQVSSGFIDFGGVQWELFGIMIFVWVIVYFCIWRGLVNARYFIWFSAISPYISLFALLIRAIFLEGAMLGIKAYIIPKPEKLLSPVIWKDAGSQVFYSYGIGFGTISALGAYNEFNHNVVRDAIAICFINGGTSIIAGFAIFATLGHLATVMNVSITSVADSGSGLAFEIYPEAVSHIFPQQLWAIVFFFMLFMLGINSQVCMTEAFYSSFEDRYPMLQTHKKKCIFVLSVFVFCLSFVMVTRSGTYWLQVVDTYAAGYSLMPIAFCEVVGIAYGYGAENIRHGIEEMLGRKISVFWIYMWKYAGPFVIFFTIVLNFALYMPVKETLQFKKSVELPLVIEVFCILLSLSSFVFVPGYAIYFMLTKNHDETFADRFAFGITTPKDISKDRILKYSLLKNKNDEKPEEKPKPNEKNL